MLIPWYANILCYPRGYMCPRQPVRASFALGPPMPQPRWRGGLLSWGPPRPPPHSAAGLLRFGTTQDPPERVLGPPLLWVQPAPRCMGAGASFACRSSTPFALCTRPVISPQGLL